MGYKSLLLIAISSIAFIILLFLDPIPQDLQYHLFADTNTHFGIPHFFNVFSNLPFLLVSIWGYSQLKSISHHCTHEEFTIYNLLLIGFLFTFLGSSYYHLNPTNATLLWDRLPMTIIFMSFFSAVCAKLIDSRWYTIGIKILIPIGMLSVIYWYVTEYYGVGDLRFYAFIQFVPLILLPLILFFYRDRIKTLKWLIFVMLAYLVAKLLESYDAGVFQHIVYISGHSLKHLFAALACFFMVKDVIAAKN